MAVSVRKAGVYVPRRRLKSDSRRGSRAFASWDEDAITMAVAASERCLAGGETGAIRSLILASTSLPYSEKQCSALVAEALDLPSRVQVLDVTNTPLAAAQALRLAEQILVGGDGDVLFVASDLRDFRPEDPDFGRSGDAAVAFLLGTDGPVRLSYTGGEFRTHLTRWRSPESRFVQGADQRFVARVLGDGVSAGLEAVVAACDDARPLDGAILGVPDRRAASRATNAVLGEIPVLPEVMQDEVGYTGTAAGPLALAAAVEEIAAPGRYAFVDWGDGFESFLVEIAQPRAFGAPVARALAGSIDATELDYLWLRNLVGAEPPTPFSSPIAANRDSHATSRRRAQRCIQCDHCLFPPAPTCPICHSPGPFTTQRLRSRGELVTFTMEHLYPGLEAKVGMGVIDLGEGQRFYSQLTDVDSDELEIGTPVELTYRLLHNGGGFRNYFWKATKVEPDDD